MYDCARHSLESNEIEGGKTQMISKEQFFTIKRLKQEGVSIAAIARRIGISEPTTRKWANMSEAGFDELMYVALSEQDLPLFYRAVNFLKEERSIIYITNRELSEWPLVADDKHLMETLTQKIMSSSQQIRLQ